MLGKICGDLRKRDQECGSPCGQDRKSTVDPCRRCTMRENMCNRIVRVQQSSKLLENVLDISTTVVEIMRLCGIHETKANKALDVIIYAFMHFDEVSEHPGGKCRKRIRKDEFINDMIRECCMSKEEAKMAYSVAKCAFKAFYHKQVVARYDINIVDECEWKNAANRTINSLIRSGATNSQVELTGRKVLDAFEKYLCRLQYRKRDTCEGEGQIRDPYEGGAGAAPDADINKDGVPEKVACELVCPKCNQNVVVGIPQITCQDPRGRLVMQVDGMEGQSSRHTVATGFSAKQQQLSTRQSAKSITMRASESAWRASRKESIDDMNDLACGYGGTVKTGPASRGRAGFFSGQPDISLAVKLFDEEVMGQVMEIELGGFCPDSGLAPDDLRYLRISTNNSAACEYDCNRVARAHGGFVEKMLDERSIHEPSVRTTRSNATVQTEAVSQLSGMSVRTMPVSARSATTVRSAIGARSNTTMKSKADLASQADEDAGETKVHFDAEGNAA